MLLPDTDERGAFLVAERLRRATHRELRRGPDAADDQLRRGHPCPSTARPRSLLRAADQALYAAKDLGKDRTVIFSAEVARVLGPAAPIARAASCTWPPLMALAEALDIRDHGNADHCARVGVYARMMAVELGLDPRARGAGARSPACSTTWARSASPIRCGEDRTAPRRGLEGAPDPSRDRRAASCPTPSSPTCASGSSPTTSGSTDRLSVWPLGRRDSRSRPGSSPWPTPTRR